MSEALLDYTVQVLSNAGTQLAGIVIILVVVCIPVVLAVRMARDGASLDAICRAAEPAYDAWGEPKRQAFRNLMQAVLAQCPCRRSL